MGELGGKWGLGLLGGIICGLIALLISVLVKIITTIIIILTVMMLIMVGLILEMLVLSFSLPAVVKLMFENGGRRKYNLFLFLM